VSLPAAARAAPDSHTYRHCTQHHLGQGRNEAGRSRTATATATATATTHICSCRRRVAARAPHSTAATWGSDRPYRSDTSTRLALSLAVALLYLYPAVAWSLWSGLHRSVSKTRERRSRAQAELANHFESIYTYVVHTYAWSIFFGFIYTAWYIYTTDREEEEAGCCCWIFYGLGPFIE
jgi:hypothetical protein